MSYQRSQEEKRLQKLLIPVNVVVCLLCIAAIVSLLIAPLFRIDFGAMMSSFTESKKDEARLETEVVAPYASEEEGNSVNKDAVFDALQDTDAVLSFTILNFGKAAFAKGDPFITLINAVFGKGFWEDMLVPAFTATVANLMRGGTNAILADANEVLKEIGGVQSEEEFAAKTDVWLDKIEEAAGEPLSDEDRNTVRQDMLETYRTAVRVTDGEFDTEAFICTAMSRSMGYDEPVADYEALTSKFFGGGAEGGSPLGEYGEMIGKYMKYVFFGLLSFVFVWFVLFLFAFFRLFAPNKRFMTWYVKLFGGLPAIIFWLVPKLIGLIMKTSSVAGMFAAFSSLAWISGLCYVLLWLVSICWAFPIKHKIRKIRKQEKEG